jgi:hypothetical protein
MIKVLITKKAYKYTPGQVIDMTEFDAGHAFGFKYGVPFVEKKYEAAIEAPIEIRVEEKPVSVFGRRGRRKK